MSGGASMRHVARPQASAPDRNLSHVKHPKSDETAQKASRRNKTSRALTLVIRDMAR
jgi:hypothetical protein